MTRDPRESATVFAPATVANVAVGFDLMGFAIDGYGDTVTVRRIPEPEVRIKGISGIPDLPLEAEKNTAGVVLIALRELRTLGFGFEIEIRKGIFLGSGMGGSAASAVGAIVAADALLEEPLSQEELFLCSLRGETLSGGEPHGDNIAPCLFGGLTIARSTKPPLDLIRLPVPAELRAVVVHPRLCIQTKQARAILSPTVPLKSFIGQSANLAGFISACYTSDYALLSRSLEDVVIEPQRSVLIPGFHDAKRAALEAGALGFSISGSGPSVFAFCRGDDVAARVRDEVRAAFSRHDLPSDDWVGPISPRGARVTEEEHR